MRTRYVLLKDTPELKKGAILEEQCDDGTQDFTVISDEWDSKYNTFSITYSREVVTKQPKWFEKVDILYLTKEQIKKVKRMLKI